MFFVVFFAARINEYDLQGQTVAGGRQHDLVGLGICQNRFARIPRTGKSKLKIFSRCFLKYWTSRKIDDQLMIPRISILTAILTFILSNCKLGI